MLMTKRKPATIGEILVEEFMKLIGLTQGALAEAMGVQRKHVNELCNDRRNVTAATALILARVFGNSPDFWLNVQRRRPYVLPRLRRLALDAQARVARIGRVEPHARRTSHGRL
jgi:antitoxin HigA-1